MSLKEREYSALIVTAAGAFQSAMFSLLPEASFHPIRCVASISAARRAMLERTFDFVIINSLQSDGSEIRFAIDACTAKGTIVLLMVREEAYPEVYDKTAEYGVFVLAKPTPKSTMATAISWMITAREKIRTFEKKTLSIEERMEEIRLVNRAKWLLIERLDMDEPDAHRYIEKQAMDHCVTKKVIAQDIIQTYSQ